MKTKLKQLKEFDFNASDVSCSLAVVSEYKKNRVSQYKIKYASIDDGLSQKLKSMMAAKIQAAGNVEEYSFDCPEPEDDTVRSISSGDTNFNEIFSQLSDLDPEKEKIEEVEELLKSRSYMIVVRDINGIKIVGYRILPENWKMKQKKGLIPLLFKDKTFEGLEEDKVFRISNTIDFYYYDGELYILSKRNFESGLNFRAGMLAKASELYEDLKESKIFVNMDVLERKVGNNLRYFRKMDNIKNLGYYKNEIFLSKFKEINTKRGWNIEINENDEIVITDEKIDDILSILQNKRLFSELTDENFDVESMKPIN